jgi:hypothetical protein
MYGLITSEAAEDGTVGVMLFKEHVRVLLDDVEVI